jgi:N6-adenosine-specific RNA methylase IME4
MVEPVYTTIFSDPPWEYADKLRMADTDRSSTDHYHTMTVEDICDLGHPRGEFIGPHQVADDALLFLCVTNPFLLDGSGARVCEAWGFRPSQLITWAKGRIGDLRPAVQRGTTPGEIDIGLILQIGMGHLFRGVTEHVIIGIRGKVKHLVQDRGVPNFLLASKGKHSAKPAELYALIERVAPAPRIEMFARERRAGWDCSGIGVGDALYVRTTPAPDVVCSHGTAMDVHCCHCHSGFIFDRDHECPERPEWDHDVEWP